MKYRVKDSGRAWDKAFDREYKATYKAHVVGGEEYEQMLTPYGRECVYREAYANAEEYFDTKLYKVKAKYLWRGEPLR